MSHLVRAALDFFRAPAPPEPQAQPAGVAMPMRATQILDTRLAAWINDGEVREARRTRRPSSGLPRPALAADAFDAEG